VLVTVNKQRINIFLWRDLVTIEHSKSTIGYISQLDKEISRLSNYFVCMIKAFNNLLKYTKIVNILE